MEQINSEVTSWQVFKTSLRICKIFIIQLARELKSKRALRKCDWWRNRRPVALPKPRCKLGINLKIVHMCPVSTVFCGTGIADRLKPLSPSLLFHLLCSLSPGSCYWAREHFWKSAFTESSRASAVLRWIKNDLHSSRCPDKFTVLAGGEDRCSK